MEFSEAEENNDYETLHLGKGVDFLADVTKQNFTENSTGKNINYMKFFYFFFLKCKKKIITRNLAALAFLLLF